MLQVIKRGTHSGISDEHKIVLQKNYLVSEEAYKKWISRIEVSKGDCVVTNVGRVAAIATIPNEVTAAIGRNMTAIRGKKNILTPTYLFQYEPFLMPYRLKILYRASTHKKYHVHN